MTKPSAIMSKAERDAMVETIKAKTFIAIVEPLQARIAGAKTAAECRAILESEIAAQKQVIDGHG